MIIGFSVRNFKSLKDFSLDGYAERGLGNFTCLVGLNGAGKSSVIQVLDFASHLMRGDVKNWLSKRSWSVADLHSKLSSGSNILLGVTVQLTDGTLRTWIGNFNRSTLSCTHERVLGHPGTKEDPFVFAKGRYAFQHEHSNKVDFQYTGSILSALKDDVLPSEILEVRNIIANIRSLELLSPHLMRMSFRDAASDIGVGGERLSSFLYGVKGEHRESLVALLKSFYPAVVDFKVRQERAGWKKLIIIESFNGELFETDAKHLNDGLLRILAILAQSSSHASMLMFDEVENGVNPEIVERLVDVLQSCGQQVLVTTHSPMILNYLSDDVAKKSVHFIYRSFDGGTRTRPLFSIPRMGAKLEYMGAGEAFVDTSLSQLTEECAAEDKAVDAVAEEQEDTK